MKLRIVTDQHFGYEVQYRVWYWPFWIQCGNGYCSANSHYSILEAEQYAEYYRNKHCWKRKVIKVLP